MEPAERRHTETGAPLGMVDKQGVCRFVSNERLACHQFLRSLGLRIGPRSSDGWIAPGWLGLIEFWDGKWHAAAWKIEAIVWTGDRYSLKA